MERYMVEGMRNRKAGAPSMEKLGTAVKRTSGACHVTGRRSHPILDRMGKRKRRQKATEEEGEDEPEKPVLPQVRPVSSL
jgi:hypothetical protein